jgi:hypothetical protein
MERDREREGIGTGACSQPGREGQSEEEKVGIGEGDCGGRMASSHAGAGFWGRRERVWREGEEYDVRVPL